MGLDAADQSQSTKSEKLDPTISDWDKQFGTDIDEEGVGCKTRQRWMGQVFPCPCSSGSNKA